MHEIKEILEESCEIVEKELKDVNKKLSASPSKNPSDIDMLDKLTHSLKSIKTTMAMIDAAEEERVQWLFWQTLYNAVYELFGS